MTEIENSTGYDIGVKGYTIVEDVTSANAAFIVRAVNCHDEFLRLLTEQLTDYEMMDAHRMTATDKLHMERIRQAIAKAEAK